uniref:Glyoxalase/fosfomycin resistance/dioxygenase domain-containing protein n=1 Tax=Gossypium raimondii TaxID=29730 RepID=A0A0D2UQU8_GOSRA|nr:hypothetical protein B456_011G081900 [Gossypium raimondii]
MKESMGNPLHLKSLNHISLVCKSVEESMNFYQDILGFAPIRRPGSFDFNGAWLFGYGIGIHLLQSEDPESLPKKKEINPKDNHISFQVISILFIPAYYFIPPWANPISKCEETTSCSLQINIGCI